MKNAKFVAWIVVCVAALAAFPASAQDAMYAVGPFNGWDAKNPLPFELEDGIFSITLDFSNDRAFKMSTVSGAGSSGNGWTEFDSGALKPVGNPAVDEWIAIKADYKGNIEAPASAHMKVEVNLAEMKMRFTMAPAPTYSGTLPVIFINTADSQPIVSKDVYLSGSYWLDPCGAEGVDAIGSSESPLPLQIRGRGNWTWTGFEKKPYRIKLADKAPLAGMKKSKHFVLLAHADDRVGFMRNTLGFSASSLIGLAWTPEQRPVEVVLNGDYIGLYFLTENIRVDKDRVNVVEQEDYATADVDGGWLVEIDNYDSDPHITVYEGTYPVWFTYKSPELLSPEQQAFLQGDMQAIQNAINAKDYAAFSELVDVDALARYYIVQEVMNDSESFHGSCYLWRQRGEAQKWNFGPVWDFGSALFVDYNNWIYEGSYHQVWIGSVIKNFPQFNDRVKAIWLAFLSAGAQNRLVEDGRSLAERIRKAAAANFRRWPAYGNADEMASAEIAFQRLDSKIDWLKDKWGKPSGISDVSTAAQAKRVCVSDGTLRIYSDEETIVDIINPMGIARRVRIAAGDNRIDGLQPGVYFIKPAR